MTISFFGRFKRFNGEQVRQVPDEDRQLAIRHDPDDSEHSTVRQDPDEGRPLAIRHDPDDTEHSTMRRQPIPSEASSLGTPDDASYMEPLPLPSPPLEPSLPLPSPPLEPSVVCPESSAPSLPSSSIINLASEALRLEDQLGDASQAGHLNDWLERTFQMANASVQEQDRSEAFSPIQPSPENEESSHESPHSSAPLRARYDRSRRNLNLLRRNHLSSNQEESVYGGRAPSTNVLKEPTESLEDTATRDSKNGSSNQEESVHEGRAPSTNVLKEPTESLEDTATKDSKNGSSNQEESVHEGQAPSTNALKEPSGSLQDMASRHSMDGLSFLVPLFDDTRSARGHADTHSAIGNDEEGNSLGRASVGLPGAVTALLNPRTDNIQAAESESLLASRSAQYVDDIIDKVSSWEECALTKQTLRERLVFKYFLQIPSSDEIDEERTKLEFYTVQQKLMGSQKFSVYARADLLQHNLLKCWVCLNQHLGAELWPEDYQPKSATREGQWIGTTDKSVIKRFEEDEASCITDSTFTSER